MDPHARLRSGRAGGIALPRRLESDVGCGRNTPKFEDDISPKTPVNNSGKDTACIGCRTTRPTGNHEANRLTASESRMWEIRPCGHNEGEMSTRSGCGRKTSLSPFSIKYLYMRAFCRFLRGCRYASFRFRILLMSSGTPEASLEDFRNLRWNNAAVRFAREHAYLPEPERWP